MVSFEIRDGKLIITLWDSADMDIISALDQQMSSEFSWCYKVVRIDGEISKKPIFRDDTCDEECPVYGFSPLELTYLGKSGNTGIAWGGIKSVEAGPLTLWVDDDRNLVVSLNRTEHRQVRLDMPLPIERFTVIVLRKVE
ncbi:hypothetical protein [Thermococcus pacificus]|uniref:Uncharacterized protein n=1 Tax=Thermococcus pacificus TaxID=71998 RepID=A0A218P689_9EURY|nr:hypothetical protein [Thermococcus pacificus]ASJ06284.1 hypothetical protein A3L08_02530 [Thermococcus pacificus]